MEEKRREEKRKEEKSRERKRREEKKEEKRRRGTTSLRPPRARIQLGPRRKKSPVEESYVKGANRIVDTVPGACC